MKTIFVLEQNSLLRYGITRLINEQGDLTVHAADTTEDNVLDEVSEIQPDLILISISHKDCYCFELIKSISAKNEQWKILAISFHDDFLIASRVLQAGGMGLISNETSPEKLLEAIRMVLKGNFYFSEDTANRIFLQQSGKKKVIEKNPLEELSEREIEVFQLIGQGYETHDISEKLHLSKNTIATYRQNIKSKLRLKSMSELIHFAYEWIGK